MNRTKRIQKSETLRVQYLILSIFGIGSSLFIFVNFDSSYWRMLGLFVLVVSGYLFVYTHYFSHITPFVKALVYSLLPILFAFLSVEIGELLFPDLKNPDLEFDTVRSGPVVGVTVFYATLWLTFKLTGTIPAYEYYSYEKETKR